jgi:diacylglycerol kinase (ATP)
VALARRFADRRRTIDLETVVTTAPGHAIELARGFVARRFDVVIAWGGDGTANEVAGPLIGTTTALGIVAEGSGDGFARGLGLPREADAALTAATDRPGVPVDVGHFGNRHFLNVAGVGFDGEVAHAFHAEGTRRGGLSYVRHGLQLAWSYRGQPYSLTLDGRHSDETLYLLAFANGREYGNGAILAPDADVSDGWLNVILLEKGPLWRQLWRARRIKFAVHRPAQGIRRFRVQSARVEARHLRCQVDGEPFDAAGAVDVRIAPGALRVAGRP